VRQKFIPAHCVLPASFHPVSRALSSTPLRTCHYILNVRWASVPPLPHCQFLADQNLCSTLPTTVCICIHSSLFLVTHNTLTTFIRCILPSLWLLFGAYVDTLHMTIPCKHSKYIPIRHQAQLQHCLFRPSLVPSLAGKTCPPSPNCCCIPFCFILQRRLTSLLVCTWALLLQYLTEN